MSSDVSLLDLSEPRSVKMFRPRMAQRVEVFTQCKGFLESGVQGNFVCGIRKTVQGVRIPVTIGIQNPSIKDWNTVPGICGVEARIQECLRFPYMGRGDS